MALRPVHSQSIHELKAAGIPGAVNYDSGPRGDLLGEIYRPNQSGALRPHIPSPEDIASERLAPLMDGLPTLLY